MFIKMVNKVADMSNNTLTEEIQNGYKCDLFLSQTQYFSFFFILFHKVKRNNLRF